MKRTFYLAIKDLAVLKADKGNVFWVFGFPILYALFFGAIFSGTQNGPSRMTVGIVNEDGSDFSKDFVTVLDNRDTLKVVTFERDEAMNRVRKGKLSCALFLKPGFGDNFGGIFSESESLEMASDPARSMETGFLQGLIVQSLFEVMQKQFMNLDFMHAHLDAWRDDIRATSDPNFNQPVFMSFIDSLETMLDDVNEVESESAMAGFNLTIPTVSVERERDTQDGPANSFQITFPQAMLWGVLGCAATFAVSLVRERTIGTMQRLRVCPISQTHILAGKGLACFMTCAFVIVVLFVGGRFIFKVPVNNVPLLCMGALCMTLCFVGIMMLVSTLGKTEQSVGGAGWALMMIMAMLGGGMVPLVFMPTWLRPLSLVSPVRWGIYALEGGIWRGLSFVEMLTPCAVLLGIGAGCFMLGLWLMKRYHGAS